MALSYVDPAVDRLCADIAALASGDPGDAGDVEARLIELAAANFPAITGFWRRTRPGTGVPDVVYKTAPPFLFDDAHRARTFRTSSTTGRVAGEVTYSERGLRLMDVSIVAGARHAVFAGLDRPVVVRLVPSAAAAPHMVMAYGMELIARTFGDPVLSTCALGPDGFVWPALRLSLDSAIAEERPVVLMGGTSAMANLCRALIENGEVRQLPAGSRAVDAGGAKSRSGAVATDELRALLDQAFGLGGGTHLNLFGMTELASQLYDSADVALGPRGERPKAGHAMVRARVRHPDDLSPRECGAGLLDVADLCVIDRPYAVLTGDWAVAGEHGVAVTGRVDRTSARGCSLVLDGITGGGRIDA
ncbi:MAG TPA: acyl-CoA reductase [Actinophytocola sp.]|uniref:acyl-CoA reductase n=1 Tax=Actinophytocola sp. TaxID=1872138 RepID=UPI002DF83553|nr:acyl-CoA reductase [Actinophytocola sp.]